MGRLSQFVLSENSVANRTERSQQHQKVTHRSGTVSVEVSWAGTRARNFTRPVVHCGSGVVVVCISIGATLQNGGGTTSVVRTREGVVLCTEWICTTCTKAAVTKAHCCQCHGAVGHGELACTAIFTIAHHHFRNTSVAVVERKVAHTQNQRGFPNAVPHFHHGCTRVTSIVERSSNV